MTRALLVLAGALVGLAAGAALPAVVRAHPPHEGVPRRPVPRAPVLAAVTAAVCAALAARVGDRPAALPAYVWMGVVGVALAVVDLRAHRLPDPLTRPSYPVVGGLLALAALVDGDGHRLLRMLVAMVVLWVLFAALWRFGGVGYGDVRLAGLLGLALGWLGWGAVLLGVVAGVGLGDLTALGLLALGHAGRRTRIPYGPFLLAGALIGALLGADV